MPSNREIVQKAISFQLKSIDEMGVFTGYGSVFGVRDSYDDVVEKGAFARSLAEHASKNSLPIMLYNHSFQREIGEWLEMREDQVGLFVKGKLWIDGSHPDQDAMKAYRGMKKEKGRMGLSIGYSIPENGSAFDSKTGITHLKDLDLWEVSPVVFPANDEARVDYVRSKVNSIRDFERFLRDSGFSRSEATAIASHGFKSVPQGDPGEEELVKIARQTLDILNRKN